MITCHNIRKSFAGEPTLKGISFSVTNGERVSIVGPGGCGKTTLLKAIVGLCPPDTGQTSILGSNLYALPTIQKNVVLRQVGMAFQQGGLFDFMNVSENIHFAMQNMTTLSAAAIKSKTNDLLQAVKLPHAGNMYPHELSGGMRRRVGIARALSTQPRVALFDEPTSGLDPVTSTIILNMILELAQGAQKPTMLVATSNMELAVRFAKRFIVLKDGNIVADDSWQHLLLYGDEWVRNFISIRFIGIDIEYARELKLPAEFIKKHWKVGKEGN